MEPSSEHRTAFKPGDVALSRDGHPLRILRIWSEDGVAVAEVRYLDGHAPYPNPNGRLGGTYDDPTWEHKVYDTRVVRTGGDYWNDADWVTEGGLRAPEEWLCPDCYEPSSGHTGEWILKHLALEIEGGL